MIAIHRVGVWSKFAFSLLLAAIVLTALWQPAVAPLPTSRVSLEHVDISKDWRFKPDPGDAGLRQNWQSPAFDDRNWALIDVGRSWDQQGFPNYSGFGWYRRFVTVPAGWRGEPLYLWLSGVDDEADVFVNGVQIAHLGDKPSNKSAHRDEVPLDITSIVQAGQKALVAVRVNNWGGDGGLKSLPVALATSNTTLFSTEMYIKHFFNRAPDLPWPYWLKDNKGEIRQTGTAWTMVGIDGGLTKGLLGLDSTVMPSQNGIAVTPWIYDTSESRLYSPAPSDVEASLASGYLPVPSTRWDIPGLVITSTLFVADPFASGAESGPSTANNPVAFYSLTVTNSGAAPRDLTLFIGIRPYGVAGRLSPIYSLVQDGPTIAVNGGIGLVADRDPEGFGATPLAGGDIGLYVRDGKLPPELVVKDDRGLASGALLYRLPLEPSESRQLTFKLPVVPEANPSVVERLRNLDFGDQHEQALQYWRSRLDGVKLSMPDRAVQDAFYASLAYLDLARNGDLFLPGPLIHRRFWYRDAAYLTTALLRTGRAGAVQPLLARIQAGQLPSGEFPPILTIDGKPDDPNKHEWDAQGEGIYTLVSYYRWTDDLISLRQAYPTIRLAAQFLRTLRSATLRASLEGTAGYGILPPSESAEDLGPATWHHYWDDFWGLVGLREAAFAAEQLGEHADVAWIQEEERALRSALLNSIAVVQKSKAIDYIPNGPEDSDSSAMARGTTPALWPGQPFDPADPLFRHSFDIYFDRFVAPSGGGYVHYAQHFWPFGGLELAHVYLLQGRFDRVQTILDWTLAHQSFPGVYAWADSMLQENNRLASGDMPHAWVAADYILLLRDMLLREDGRRLILGSYLPRSWLADGREVAVARLPTIFGPVGFSLLSHQAAGFWDLSLDAANANPPEGYLWPLPPGFVLQQVIVDGKDWHGYDNSGITFPAATRSVRLYGHFLTP